jgi:protein-tyrosine phosphatase
MNWIVDGRIAIGNVREAMNPVVLREHAFGSVLALIEETITEEDLERAGLESVEIESVPLEDGRGNDLLDFRRAVHALEDLVRHAGPVLFHCQPGKSRSAVVVAGFLVREHDVSADEALRRVAARRELTVHPVLLTLLRSFAADPGQRV